MKPNEKRSLFLAAFFLIYALGLPISKLTGITSFSWTFAFMPIILPISIVIGVMALSIPFFIYTVVLEYLYSVFPDICSKA